MDIAFLILDMNSGGAQRATSSLANYMSSKGHNVSVITVDNCDSFYSLDGTVKKSFLELPKLPKGKGLRRLFAVIGRSFALRKNVQALNPDVIIGMSNVMTSYAIFCTKFSKIKAIGTERSNPYLLNASPLMGLLRKVNTFLCDGFIFQTEKAKQFFPKAAYKKCVVIPNAVFNPLVKQIEPSEKRSKTISAMGRLSHEKGFDTLINAFSFVEKSAPDFNLIIYGEGELRDKLLSRINDLGLLEKVNLLGENVNALFDIANSSVFVLSSRFEGMPNALMEAMACGVPCVSTKCEMGPEELISDGENGLLVPVNDEQALAKAILRIVKDKQLSSKLSKNCIKIRETHSIEAIGNKWINVCSRVIDG